MSIEFACHACGKPVNAQSADQAGSVIKCPACDELVVVPQSNAEPPAETPGGFPVKAIALAGGGVLILAAVLYLVLGGEPQPDKGL